MSSLIVKVQRIEKVVNHNNANKLDVVTVGGWESIVGRDQFKVGDLVVFIPPDAVLPEQLINDYNLRPYLRGAAKNRVGVAKLRGIMSYGIVLPAGPNCVEGEDAADLMGIEKYAPPVRCTQGQPREKDLTFPEYLEIENFKNFKSAFFEGEPVIVTEKIDGTNCRIGVAITDTGFVLKAGSHRVNRDNPGEENWEKNIYWHPHSLTGIKRLWDEFVLGCIEEPGRSLILYGEVYGAVRGGLKSMHYGTPGHLQFRAFAAMVDYNWCEPTSFLEMCRGNKIPTVKVLYKGPFGYEYILSLLERDSVTAAENGHKQIMEGVVIQSTTNPLKILKLINPEYLLLKNKAEDKGETFDVEDV